MADITVSQITEKIKGAEKISILCHTNPDEDTVCSAYALYLALQEIGKSAKIFCDKIPPKRTHKYVDTSVFCQNGYDGDSLVIAVDTASPSLLGSLEECFAGKVDILIDHHESSREYAEFTLSRPEESACAMIVYELISELAFVTPEIATLLYMAISSDTGSFKYSNTTPKAHRIAAELMEKGAKASGVSEDLFDIKSPSAIRAMRVGLEYMRYIFGGKVAIISLTCDEKRREGLNDADLDELSPISLMTEGVILGAVLKECDGIKGKYRVSLRSRENVDAARICERLGGGGHKRAAGATIVAKSAKEAEEMLISAIIPGLAR